MKRRLVIEIDCGAKRCKECMYSGDGCELFGAERRCDDKVRPLRLPACLDAEREAIARGLFGGGYLGEPAAQPSGLRDPMTFTYGEKAKP
jgi:hypothetical protein